jgi:hypothetical protein
MAHVIGYLLSKCKALNSNPTTAKKIPKTQKPKQQQQKTP